MAVQGIGGGGGFMQASFKQANLQAHQLGDQSTARAMYESHPHNPVNGAETNLGTSQFSKSNDELIEVSVEKVAEIMEQDDGFAKISNTGSESLLGPSNFQEMNDRSYSARQQAAASAYNYFNG